MNQQPLHVHGARAQIVNRTHRIVRARAAAMHARKARERSLWVPLAICSALLITLSYAAWTIFWPANGGEQPVLSSEPGTMMEMLLMWFLPLTVALGVFILVRRNRADSGRYS
ncbi:MAG: hypothetical protein JSS87_10720 [Acidobacteria bacterium]|nr:hypothetical protein [Acidobacteriota bacterium]